MSVSQRVFEMSWLYIKILTDLKDLNPILECQEEEYFDYFNLIFIVSYFIPDFLILLFCINKTMSNICDIICKCGTILALAII